MEQQINEAGLPMNFSWRAGIGKEIGASQKQDPANVRGFSPFDSGFHPNQSYKIPQGLSPQDFANLNKRNDMQFNQSLLYELDTHLSDIGDNYKHEAYGHSVSEQLKQDMRNYMASIVKKYGGMISGAFMELLYNTCLQSYTNAWVIQCGNEGITDISATEMFINKVGEVCVNPFLIYSLFATTVKGCDTQIQEEMICG